jgi:hypothetical protein
MCGMTSSWDTPPRRIARGRTVDTAHTIAGPNTAREVLYVVATRGRDSNTIYVDTENEPDVDTGHGPAEERS